MTLMMENLASVNRFEQFQQLTGKTTEELLQSGGDARLELDPQTGVNKYGCGKQPDRAIIALGSSTGTTLSERGFTAAATLHQRLLEQLNCMSEAKIYRRESDRLRMEFNQLCDCEHDGISTIFAASGTDLHLICAQLLAKDKGMPLHLIMMDASETGSGVAPAVRGQHFSKNAALGGEVTAFEAIAGSHAIEVSSIKLRRQDGMKRTLSSIDFEVNGLIQHALANQQHVLLIMIDVSKTGLIAPSPGFIKTLRQNYPDQVDILIDACQFRLSNPTLKAYLKLGCMVALTGSKFLTGPVFSGILQIPPNLVGRLSQNKLPASLADYSAEAEWPESWLATKQLTHATNWGLLLRLEAALAELRAFRAIPEARIKLFLDKFQNVMQHAIQSSPHFSLLSEKLLDRSAIFAHHSWDQVPTIFPFILQHQPGKPVTREQTQLIYKQLQCPLSLTRHDIISPAIANLRCQLGQPVLCGNQHGVDVSALRLCVSSRMIIEACDHGVLSNRQVIQNALNALEKTAYLVRRLK